jgi:hypothetical protein
LIQQHLWGRFMYKPVINTICNDCGFSTKHSTRTKAFVSMGAHEIETDHFDQMFSTISDGWVRFKTLNYEKGIVN